MKKTIIALSLAAMSLPALAQQKAPEPDYTISGNFGLVSDYRFRGISQSDKKPAIQGGVDFAHKSGFYLGNWNSSVSEFSSPQGSGIEMDLYGGYKTEVAGIALDFGAIYYYYPGAKDSSDSYNPVNTREVYVGLGYGPLSLKASRTVSGRYFGIGKGDDGDVLNADEASAKGTMYYDLTFSKEIAPKITLKAHAGFLDFKNKATNQGTLKDYSVGIAYDLDGWVWGLTAFTTSGLNTDAKDGFFVSTDGKKLWKSGAALSLTKAF